MYVDRFIGVLYTAYILKLFNRVIVESSDSVQDSTVFGWSNN